MAVSKTKEVKKKTTKVKASAAAGNSSGRWENRKQMASQKIAENLKDLDESQHYAQIHAGSGLTCAQAIMRDLEQLAACKSIKLGKLYYVAIRTMLDRDDSLK